MIRRLFAVVLVALISPPAVAESKAEALEVVATTASLGMLAREIGAERVQVEVLAPPDRDIHALQARPTMIRRLRGADLLLAVGADLEAAWLPAALRSAANPSLLPGRKGHFEAAAHVALMDAGQPADRARGDVHPAGNPHLHMDPIRLAEVGRALAEHLGGLNPAQAEAYRRRAEGFARQVEARMDGWRERARQAPGAVLYHKSVDYLLARLEVSVLGYLEPVPGVPPTPGHLRGLVEDLRGRPGVILFHDYHPSRGPDFLAEALGWPVWQLPLEPSMSARAEDYFVFIDEWVRAVSEPGG